MDKIRQEVLHMESGEADVEMNWLGLDWREILMRAR